MLKNITLIAILLLNFVYVALGQVKFNSSGVCNIKGNIKGFTDKHFVLAYDFQDQYYETDTIDVINGKFSWSGKIIEPKRALMMFSRASVNLYLDPTNMTIEGRADSLFNLKVTGSKTDDEARAYALSLNPIRQQIGKVAQKIRKADQQALPALKQDLAKLNADLLDAESNYIREHPDSPVSLSLVVNRTHGSYESTVAGFEMLSEKIRNTLGGKDLAKRLVILQRTQLGQKFLDFTQKDPNGKAVKFADFRGKYVFIDFWASWCGPCRRENPNLLKAYNQFRNNNFTVIGVSLDEEAEFWKRAIQEDNLPWTQVSDLKGWKNKISSYYGVSSIPRSILVDPEGRIIAKNLSAEELNNKLSELFAGNSNR